MEKRFKEKIHEIVSENNYCRFDTFIINEMGFEIVGPNDNMKKKRHQALLEFRKRTGRNNIATLPTIRRWFGINSYRRPSREHIYKICFALGADRKKTAEYLTRGIGEPYFQINDYIEMIYLYGIDNKLSYEECEKMIDFFESSLDDDVGFSGMQSTKDLWNMYELKMMCNKEEFLEWMLSRAEWFRGYSITLLRYLKLIKSEIIKEIKNESAKILEERLKETGYYIWREKCKDNKEEHILIRKFVKSNRGSNIYKVSESLGKVILELCSMVYDTRENNRRLLEAIYYSFNRQEKKKRMNYDDSFYVMGEKYLSDLLRVPIWKEKMVNIQRANRILQRMSDDNQCPKWIERLCVQLHHTYDCCALLVCDAKQIVEKYLKENQRRCLLLQRNDIMPMVLYLAQSRYSREHPKEYNPEKAKESFIELMDSVLTACYMEPFNEKNELDKLLLACFQEEEMYSYSDVLDAYYESV